MDSTVSPLTFNDAILTTIKPNAFVDRMRY